jgi:hypothetical protein
MSDWNKCLFVWLGIEGLLCYQCAMKYSNDECNANNSTYATECQPTFDTCVTIILKPGRDFFVIVFFRLILVFSSHSQSIIDYKILYETSCMWTTIKSYTFINTLSTEWWRSKLGLCDMLWRSRFMQLWSFIYTNS